MKNRFLAWLGASQQRDELHTISSENLPRHIAIIMDGNGRWANQRSLPRVAGHRKGMKTVKDITIACNKLGVEYLTLYAFSTENWKRPKQEVEYLMHLPQEFLKIELAELIENNIQVRMMGDQDQLPEYTIQAVTEAVEKTRENTGLVLNFALNYGSRHELCQAMVEIGKSIDRGEMKPEDITEQIIETHLFSHTLSDPDLLIRTGGELRLSNFMLWQAAYSELWFTEVYWPSFTKVHLHEAISEYQRRTRRYGGIT